MLNTDDVAKLFAEMKASYGYRWRQTPDDIPVWLRRLGGFNRQDLQNAVDRASSVYPDGPPNLGQFEGLVTLSSPQGDENLSKVERVKAYTLPYDKTKNPKGNTHGIRLPDSIADRKMGELADQYEKRIADEITFAMYPNMRRQFQNGYE